METTTSIYEQANYFFPDSDDSSKLFLRDVLKVFEFASHPTIRIQFYIAILGLIVTFFHLIILTRKSMITTSVISIMIGVGTCDLLAMIATIIYSWIIYNEDDTDPCVHPLPLTQMYVYWVFINLRELVRRSSTWLGVVMALIRYINLKSDKTTGLVIFMTFSFFIVELPIGIVVVLQVAYTELGYL
ncbi:hypothetical protein GCK72_019844 [Caenorhabditis remanei]|uniref:G-protein coupled receptors family 1 profile domain-containing protein n=1 Tax=Caenorhabditis remanei TaxID=31234 RepID=A0A6A5GDT1_CAERE|nr:hypothetical protein GCK72_019844 [Caenorhabditis remanei]KAF1753288.1 hypothetical protein GCK72_019844 [Caenorhabditis remanei]